MTNMLSPIDIDALDDEIVAHLSTYARHTDNAVATGILAGVRMSDPEKIAELVDSVFEEGFNTALQLTSIVSESPLSVDVDAIGEVVDELNANLARQVERYLERLCTGGHCSRGWRR